MRRGAGNVSTGRRRRAAAAVAGGRIRGGILALLAGWACLVIAPESHGRAWAHADDFPEYMLLLFGRSERPPTPAPTVEGVLDGESGESAPIPAGLFGMHMLHLHDGTPTSPGWPTVPIGSARINVDSGMSWYYRLERSPGQFDWKMLDAWLDDAWHHNADLVYTFGNTPPWASRTGRESCDGSGHANCPPKLEAWDAFVRAIVEHNKQHVNPDGSVGGRIRYWELWNEPNEGTYSGKHGFWYDPADFRTLVEMARHLERQVKSIDPAAKVLTPAYTSSGRGEHPAAQLKQYLDAGGGKYADIVSFHGYYRDAPEDIVPYVAEIQKSMAAHGIAGKPLWDTEASWGWDKDFADSNTQQAFVARSYALHYSLGVSRLYWYAWDGSAGRDVQGWGTLWDKTKGAHPAARAYGETYRWLVGATMTRRCAPRQGAVWSCALSRPGGYRATLVWSTAGAASYPRPPDEHQYRTLDGDLVVTSGKTVPIGPKPILLETGSAW